MHCNKKQTIENEQSEGKSSPYTGLGAAAAAAAATQQP